MVPTLYSFLPHPGRRDDVRGDPKVSTGQTVPRLERSATDVGPRRQDKDRREVPSPVSGRDEGPKGWVDGRAGGRENGRRERGREGGRGRLVETVTDFFLERLSDGSPAVLTPPEKEGRWARPGGRRGMCFEDRDRRWGRECQRLLRTLKSHRRYTEFVVHTSSRHLREYLDTPLHP